MALGRRAKDIAVDRIGAYKRSEINPAYSEAVLQLRGQCDHDKDTNCTTDDTDTDTDICHYITPEHMKYLWSHRQRGTG